MPAKPVRFQQVIDLLTLYGPLSTSQMAKLAGVNQRTMGGGVRTARKFKRIYVLKWKRSYTTRGRWGAVYWLGSKPDADPPKSDRSADSKRHYVRVIRPRKGATPRKKANPWSGLCSQ